MSDTFLAEIIATRLSPDLIGNIGAVSNAVELLNEGDEQDLEDVNNILNFSSKVLSKRLKFFWKTQHFYLIVKKTLLNSNTNKSLNLKKF